MISKIALFLAGVSFAQSQISYSVDTRKVSAKPSGTGDDFANNMRDTVNNAPQPDGYCFAENPSFPLDNSGLCGSNSDIGWIFNFDFADNEDANYVIQFGTDFGYGATVWVDGALELVREDDLWWAGNWNSDAVFQLDYLFTAGEHTVQIIGAEACCDGAMDVQFSRNGDDFQSFNLSNLEAAIPEWVEEAFTGVTIDIGTRYGTGSVAGQGEEFGNNLVTEFNAASQPIGYCNTSNPDFPLSNAITCGSNSDILWQFSFKFYNADSADWVLEFGTDFGRGVSIWIDGVWSQSRTDDLWWAGNWNSGAVFKIQESWGPGVHEVLVHGSEKCCDGAMDVRFSYNGGDYQELTQDNVSNVVNSDPIQDCVVLYDACDFLGASLEVCESNPDTSNFHARSVYVPQGTTATLFNTVYFEGQQVEFTESVNCMDGPDFQDPNFLELHHITLVDTIQKKAPKEQSSHLRKNAHHKKHHSKSE